MRLFMLFANWTIFQTHQPSFWPGGCTSLPGSSWSPPAVHFPEWPRWWGNGRTQNAFYTGNPAFKQNKTVLDESRVTTKQKSIRSFPKTRLCSAGKTPHQSDAFDHVLNMAADSTDCGQLLPVSPPFIHTKLRMKTSFVCLKSLPDYIQDFILKEKIDYRQLRSCKIFHFKREKTAHN